MFARRSAAAACAAPRLAARRLASLATPAEAPVSLWNARDVGAFVSVLLVVFSVGAGATQVMSHKDALVSALEVRVAGLKEQREAEREARVAERAAEREAADAKLETVRSQLAGATREFEAKLAGAKGEFEAKLMGAGLAAEVAALRVLKEYSVSVAGGEASKVRGGAE